MIFPDSFPGPEVIDPMRVIGPTKLMIDKGLVFEINRQILHPLGYSLMARVADADDPVGQKMMAEADYCMFTILDIAPTDPEGMIYSQELLDYKTNAFNDFTEECAERIAGRIEKLGYLVQGSK